MNCPFCAQQTVANALVCGSCSRDIAVPASLIAERDDLIRKRDAVRKELLRVKGELEKLRQLRKRLSV
jgi:hypothetical protein